MKRNNCTDHHHCIGRAASHLAGLSGQIEDAISWSNSAQLLDDSDVSLLNQAAAIIERMSMEAESICGDGE